MNNEHVQNEHVHNVHYEHVHYLLSLKTMILSERKIQPKYKGN